MCVAPVQKNGFLRSVLICGRRVFIFIVVEILFLPDSSLITQKAVNELVMHVFYNLRAVQ